MSNRLADGGTRRNWGGFSGRWRERAVARRESVVTSIEPHWAVFSDLSCNRRSILFGSVLAGDMCSKALCGDERRNFGYLGRSRCRDIWRRLSQILGCRRRKGFIERVSLSN